LSARSLGSATTPGWLLHLGDYPGLVTESWWQWQQMPPPDSLAVSPRVHGQLIEVPDLARAVAVLDDEEGCLAADIGLDSLDRPLRRDVAFGHGLYVRRLVPMLLSTGANSWAWTYVYNQPVPHPHCIPSGDWLSLAGPAPRESRE
jgi:gamma-glutamylcyclotransferase (GGCT)/AIG2-like uncharacterized protein YtfP